MPVLQATEYNNTVINNNILPIVQYIYYYVPIKY